MIGSFADSGCTVKALLVVEGSSATVGDPCGGWEAVWGASQELAVDLGWLHGFMQALCKLGSYRVQYLPAMSMCTAPK